jgi:membrane protease YdiL (CAAX protease family)
MNATLTFGTKRTFKAKQVVNDFLTYVRKPLYIAEDATMSKIEKFQYLFKVLLCKLALLPILIPIIYLTKQLTGAKSAGFEDTWSMYFMLVVIAPIVEESIFRGALHYSRWGVSFFVSVLLLTITYMSKINELISIHVGFVYMACMLLFPMFYFATKRFDAVFEAFWSKNFKYIFHLVAVGFGLVHLSNYDNISNYLFAVPLVTSQIVSGYVLGFVRMKLGFGYSVALHSAWNFVAGLGLLMGLVAKFF